MGRQVVRPIMPKQVRQQVYQIRLQDCEFHALLLLLEGDPKQQTPCPGAKPSQAGHARLACFSRTAIQPYDFISSSDPAYNNAGICLMQLQVMNSSMFDHITNS